MTKVFENKREGPGTHAFIIGVGHYPHARTGTGIRALQRSVEDIPSAADSAKYMHDWLVRHALHLAAPLASIEMVLADPPAVQNRYVWANAQPVDDATSDNVLRAGEAWISRLTAKAGETGIFYACGHGAGLANQPVVFLSDLNSVPREPWTHHNIWMTASSCRQLHDVKSVFFFADTCRELIPRFSLTSTLDLSRFLAAADPFEGGIDKVSLLCATSESMRTLDGIGICGNVKLGRFTQTLVRALDSSSARRRGNAWAIGPGDLEMDLKVLKRLYFPAWREAFEPSHVMTQNEFFPIISHRTPNVPVVVLTDPEDAMTQFDLKICIHDHGGDPRISDRMGREKSAWLTHVPAGLQPLYAIAEDPPQRRLFNSVFVPNAPIFDQRILIS